MPTDTAQTNPEVGKVDRLISASLWNTCCPKTSDSTVENGQRAKRSRRSIIGESCHNHTFVATKRCVLSRQKSYLWQLPPMIEIKLIIQENCKPQDLTVTMCTDGSVTKDQSWMVGLHCQATCDHHPWRQCSPNLHLDNGWRKRSSTPSAGLTQEVTVRPHHALRWIDSRGDSQTTPCPPLDWLKRWQTTPCPQLDWLKRWQSDHTMPSAGLTQEVTVRPHHALRWIDSRGDRPHHALHWIDSRGDSQTTPCPPLDWLKRWQSDHMCHQPHRLSELATKSGIEGRDWNVSIVDIHLQKLLWLYHRGDAGLRGNVRADRLAGKINHHKLLASWKLWSVEELETLSLSTKPMTSHHWSSGGERHGKRKRLTIFVERTREGHRQWDKHWNCYKGNVGKTAERRGEAHMGFLERIDTILNWNEQVKAIKRK